MKSKSHFSLVYLLLILSGFFLVVSAADARPKMTNSQKKKADACYQDYYDCQVGCALDKTRTADQCSYECGTYYFDCMKKASLSRFAIDVTKMPINPSNKMKEGQRIVPSDRLHPDNGIATEPAK